MFDVFGIRTRAKARRLEDQARLHLAQQKLEIIQSYDAARQGGRNAGWRRPFSSANAELQGALPYLRATSRDLVRNAPHATRATRVLASHIVGTGVRPRAIVEAEDKDTREAIQRITRDQWSRFVENCDPEGRLDFYGQDRLIARTVVESGEALRLWMPVSDNGRLFWRTRVIEGDYLDHQRNEILPGGRGKIVQGVEFNALGARVAYHMFTTHPGDRLSLASRFETVRIPAAFVDHVFETLRPGQVRGVSWFAPAAMVLRDVDDLAEAEVVRKKLEACISMVIHNANGVSTNSAALTAATDDAGGALTTSAGDPIERMQPGMILNAPPGWSADFNAPPASDGLVEHMRERLHAVAAGVGTTYMQMTGDTSQANYSSMREGRIEFNKLVDVWQADLVVHQAGRPAWRRVMRAAQANGDLRLAQMPRATYVRPKRPWVDPQKDASAAIKEMEAGLADPIELIEEKGQTVEDVVGGAKRFVELTREAGLTLTPDLGGAPAAATPEDDA